jgi:hypothetical protein
MKVCNNLFKCKYITNDEFKTLTGKSQPNIEFKQLFIHNNNTNNKENNNILLLFKEYVFGPIYCTQSDEIINILSDYWDKQPTEDIYIDENNRYMFIKVSED